MNSIYIKANALFEPDSLSEFSNFPKVLVSWSLKSDL